MITRALLKPIVLILALSISICLKAQSDSSFTPLHRYGDRDLFISVNHMVMTPKGIQTTYGVKLRMFVGKRLSFDSDLSINGEMAQFGYGMIGIPVLYRQSRKWNEETEINLEEGWLGNLILKVAFIAVSAEHITYHIPFSDKLEISPYASFLRQRIFPWQDTTNSDEIVLFDPPASTLSTGIEFNIKAGIFLFSPYVEYNLNYGLKKSGVSAGLNIGTHLPRHPSLD